MARTASNIAPLAQTALRSAARKVAALWSPFPTEGVHPALAEAAMTRVLQRQALHASWPRLAQALDALAQATPDIETYVDPVPALALDTESYAGVISAEMIAEQAARTTCAATGHSVPGLTDIVRTSLTTAVAECDQCHRTVPLRHVGGAFVYAAHASIGASHE